MAFDEALPGVDPVKLFRSHGGLLGRGDAVGDDRRDPQPPDEIPVRAPSGKDRRVLLARAGESARVLQVEVRLAAHAAGKGELDDVLVVGVARRPAGRASSPGTKEARATKWERNPSRPSVAHAAGIAER